MKKHSVRPLTAITVALAMVGACDRGATTPGAEQRVSIAFSSQGSRTALADTARVSDSLIITKAELVISELELSRVAGDSLCSMSASARSSGSGNSGPGNNGKGNRGRGSDDEEKEHNRRCPRIELGPILVPLPLGPAAVTRFATSIPEGVYREIEFEIDRPQTDSAGTAFIARNPDFRDISVRAEGRYRNAAFIYAGRVKAEIELEFKPSLTVAAGGTAVNIRVDFSRWFRAADGTPISPSTANAGGPNAARVAQNIARSFRVLAGGAVP